MQIELSEQEKQVLEQVQKQLQLDTLEEAATWLLKSHLRQSTQKLMGGRGRALYVVKK